MGLTMEYGQKVKAAMRFLDGDDGGKYAACVAALKLGAIDAEKERLAAEYGAETDKDKKKDLLIRIAALDAERAKLRVQGR